MVGVEVAEDTAEWSHLVSLPQAGDVRVDASRCRVDTVAFLLSGAGPDRHEQCGKHAATTGAGAAVSRPRAGL